MISFKQIIRDLFSLIRLAWNEDKFLLLGYYLSSLFGVFLLFAVFFVYKLLIDQVTISLAHTPTNILFLVIVTYLFFEYLTQFVYYTINQYYFDFLIRSKMQNILTRHFMEKVADLDFQNLENGDVRNLIARVQDFYMWRMPDVLRIMNSIIYNSAGFILSFIIALRFGVIYFLILTLVSAPFYYLRTKYGNVSYLAHSENAKKTNYLWYLRHLFTTFQTMSEMKIYNLKDHFIKETQHTQNILFRSFRKPIAAYSLFSSISSIIIPIAIFFALNNFIIQLFQKKFSLGDFTLFLNILFAFSGQISQILVNLGSIYENSLFIGDYFKLQSLKNSIKNIEKPHIFTQIEPREIRFVDVCFAYPGSSKLVLNNINLVIKKGENTAIVGHNGAGKSTLIKLLLRFYDPTGGTILIDGVDLKEIDINNWYDHIGILFQDFAKYFLTLKENIEFGNIKKKDIEQLKKTLKKAEGEDLLAFLPKGFDQILGRWFEEGIELSVGQWQKVAIARALYRNAPILILDEPTSAIDAEAEYEIFNNLETTYKNKNLIFISHRFSTVRMADKIFVMDAGEIREQGTHKTLIKKKGLYHHYFSIQKKGYE